MNRQRKEYKINLFSGLWTVGLMVLTLALSALVQEARAHPSSWLQQLVYVSVGLYAIFIVLAFEIYQKLLDERVRLRNAEAARITGSVMASAGMVYLFLSGSGKGPAPSIDVPVLFFGVYGIYLVSYFVLWFRGR